MGIFKNINLGRLKEGLSKTKTKLLNSITEVISGKAVIDDKTLEEIEEILITSDIGYETSVQIIDNVRIKLRSTSDRSNTNLISAVKSELHNILNSTPKTNFDEELIKYKPYVILIVGVNGAGKTTTIGKLSHNFKRAGLKVIVGAADTFRAAANEQLDVWAQRANVKIVSGQQGSDPAAVAYATINQAIEGSYDVVLIDTAGRLHNKSNLMDELGKINRVINKKLQYAPNEILLVLDGTTGQNAIKQAEEFGKVVKLTGLVLTKIDGTSKGGIIFHITNKLKIPVKYIGVGEKIDDLQNFDPELL
ncbi:MAG: signal recognition particle-docking protein FtsY [Ignavibacteriales bacterium]|nr:signal recognition particle-docking protein FtsY [Ignavibacteriales bacterium]